METITQANEKKSTRVYKGWDGWQAETKETVNGQTWQITTSKRANGLIACSCYPITVLEDSVTVSVSQMMGETITLFSEKGTGTEKKIREVHQRGILEFDTCDKVQNRVKKYEIKVGQVLQAYSGGQYSDDGHKYAIVSMNDRTAKIVGLETLSIRHTETYALKSIENIFGIGTYYLPGEFLETDELLDLMNRANEKEQADEREKFAKKTTVNAERAAKIEIGAKVLPALPEGVVSVIVAELRQDESDSMTDYFAHSTSKVLYLAFSGHKKDLFAEMRKACLNSDVKEIKAYAAVPTVDRNGEPKTDNNADWWHPADEHREKYSMGDGYYLGASAYSGWVIKKETYGFNLEALQIAIAEGRFFVPMASDNPKDGETNVAVTVSVSGVTISDYSEKAIVVRGETKQIKEELKALGGRFNFRLTGGAGWIFSKRDEQKVKALLGL
ncbi:hypothetical protein [Dyadobacter sp. CY312]|uniref:hypothetical protein n=1 Tax=Dyadobacter sp. CY312 TaxID=2907303 RepID=UPI001F2BFAFF|nr:hypothetical protein [Dyadobacter sp. CY312]MCE7039182.1 hypothetical protein [Dyadobacter sp. CY312]